MQLDINKSNLLRLYLKDFQNSAEYIGIIVALPNCELPHFVGIGVALCNTKYDKFNKNIALQLAIYRAENYYENYKLKNRIVYTTDMSNFAEKLTDSFVKRCVRYYKDKNIIYPNIKWV